MSNKNYLYEKFQIEEYMTSIIDTILSTKWDGNIPKEVVFFGDSIIRDYDLNKFFPDIKNKVVNCGLAGATTEALFYILKQGVVRHNPKVVVMLVGTNDISDVYHKRNEEIIFNISRIIMELKIILKGVNIVLISILPCDEGRYGKNLIIESVKENSRIIEINEVLEEFENYFKDFTFIDVYDRFIDKNGNLINSLTHDGLHLNLDGYEKLTEIITPIIKQLLK